jgi:glycosyltransferase involved in cell wall biosynthesis
MGKGTEIIFVEGNSKDNTWGKINEVMCEFENTHKLSAYKQLGRGKNDAVRLGFEKASGDIVMILDADLTVPPESLPDFYRALVQNKGDFIMGSRLVYPLEKDSMQFLNILGNKFFSAVFSWILSLHVKDTLCGTKVLFKSDYVKLTQARDYFGDFDPFGDFDLIFGAHKLNLRIIEVPIRYSTRSYGSTNISRFTHGWLLLKMAVFATRKIKFYD